LTAETEELQGKVAGMDELEKRVADLNITAAALSAESDKVPELEGQLSLCKEEKSILQGKADQASSLEIQNSGLERENEKMDTQIKLLEQQGKEGDVKTKQLIGEMQTRLEDAQRSKDSCGTDLKKAQEAALHQDSEISKAKARNEKLRNEQQDLGSKVQTLESAKLKLEEDLGSATRKVQSMQDENANLKTALQTQTDAAQDAKRAAVTAKSGLDLCERENTLCDGSLAFSKESVRTANAEKAEVESKLADAEAERDAIARTIDSVLEARDQLQGEADMCVGLEAQAQTSLRLARRDQKECASTVKDLLEEQARLQAQLISPEQKEERRETSCQLFGKVDSCLLKWDQRTVIEENFQSITHLNENQAQRQALLQHLEKLGDDQGKVTFSAWLGDRVSNLISEKLGNVQRRLLKIPRAIEMITKENARVQQEIEVLRADGIKEMEAFKDHLIEQQLKSFDDTHPPSVRFNQVVESVISDFRDTIDRLKQKDATPASEISGLGIHFKSKICQIMPFLHEQGGGEEKCAKAEPCSVDTICTSADLASVDDDEA